MTANKFTIVWMDDQLQIGIEAYEGATPDAAVAAWEADTTDCTLIGILDGEPDIHFWASS